MRDTGLSAVVTIFLNIVSCFYRIILAKTLPH